MVNSHNLKLVRGNYLRKAQQHYRGQQSSSSQQPVSLMIVGWAETFSDITKRKRRMKDSKVRELIAVKLQHTSVLNITVVAFKIIPLGSCSPMPAPSLPFKTILELVLWNGLQSCRNITPGVIKCLRFNIFFKS
jgi:hypothetical protein